MTVLLAGGGLGRGQVFGATDGHGREVTDNPCSPDDVSATIFSLLGFPPSHRVTALNGRPMLLFRDGQVLDGVLA
jgi:hypothetical protein